MLIIASQWRVICDLGVSNFVMGGDSYVVIILGVQESTYGYDWCHFRWESFGDFQA